MPPADEPAADGLARPVRPRRKPDVFLIKNGLEPHDAADLEIAPKEIKYERGMLLDDMERPVLDPIADRNHAAHPDALLLRGGDLVPDPLAGDLALELGEGEKHIQSQPPHAGRRVERLGDRDERHLMRVEELDQLGEVGERARQPVDFVDHDHVDATSAHVVEQPFEGRPLHRAAGVAAIVVAVADQLPAFVGLALDIGLRRLPLIVERVELLLQAVSESVAKVIAYVNSTTGPDSNAGKYFFANGTTDGKKPVSNEAMAIFHDVGGALS